MPARDGTRALAPDDGDDRAPGAWRYAPTGRRQVAQITARRHADYPKDYDAAAGYTITLTPFKEVLGQDAQLTLSLLMAAAAFVLVIVLRECRQPYARCAVCVANMRSAARRHRRRHQVAPAVALHRDLVLALAAVLDWWGWRMPVWGCSSPSRSFSARAREIRLDGMSGFTLVIAAAVALLLSFAPHVGADHQLGAGLFGRVDQGHRSMRRRRVQQGLVVTQIAVSAAPLTGTGRPAASMQRLAAVDPGLKTDNVLTMPTSPWATDRPRSPSTSRCSVS